MTLEKAHDLHARGVAAKVRGRPEEGARLLRAGLRLLGPDLTDPATRGLAGRLLISLGAAEVQLGDSDAGFARLDDAADLIEPRDRGVLQDQRGWSLLYVGRLDEALKCMDQAIPALEANSDALGLARGLLNRAMLHELTGRLRPCRMDLDRCERLARQENLPRLVAKAQLNRGYCEWLTGDIPAALREFEAAGRGLAEHAPALLPVLAVDKARVLLSVGLAAEAGIELDSALDHLSGSRSTHERAEAELMRAQAAVAQQDFSTARRWARQAERRFRRRGNESWAAVAALVRLRADFAAGRSVLAIRTKAVELAHVLQRLDLRNDAEVAGLLAARASTSLGDPVTAAAHLRRFRTAQATVETRLLRHLAGAELHAATGHRRKAFAQVRAGLAVLRDQRRRLGSVDLQTGTTALGLDLARMSLSMAALTGRPKHVFDWLERTRAQAFQVPPVRTSSNTEMVEALAALRQAVSAARTAELAGRRDLAAERRRVELERLIRSRSWLADGSGLQHATVGFEVVTDLLDGENAVLVSYFAENGRLGSLVVADGRGRLVDAGALLVVTEAIDRLRSDLDALCGRTLPSTIAAVVRDSMRNQVAVLVENLLAPVEDHLGDRDLVIVPTGPLVAVPWGLFPGLRGRPVTVAVSASAWSAAACRPSTTDHRGPLLVAGPHLAHAEDEVRRISQLFSDGKVLVGPAATVEATLAALRGRQRVHFAAHGHHEPGNFLFSRLDLADGPLMAYDIHHLESVPEHVVLSSCDVGRTVVRSGDEMLGFTAALLYSGTRTVVAGVARVPDEAALGVMTDYHHRQARGVPPARALADSLSIAPTIPLVCFGYGGSPRT